MAYLEVCKVGNLSCSMAIIYIPNMKSAIEIYTVRYILHLLYDLYSIGLDSLTTAFIEINIAKTTIVNTIFPALVFNKISYHSLFIILMMGIFAKTRTIIYINSFIGSNSKVSNWADTILLSESLLTTGTRVCLRFLLS